MDDKNAKIFIAGHRGLVGSAILRRLQRDGFSNLIPRTHRELDLCDQGAVERFFAAERPDFVFLAAAKVGGIYANDSYPADFIRDNLLIQTHVIDAAYRHGAKKLLFLGSSCIYPKMAPQPLKEDYLLTGPLEPTNEWYAIAKIAGIKMCQAYRRQYGFNAISVMPTNLYGPNDHFDLQTSHVLPALIRKFHLARLADYELVIARRTGSGGFSYELAWQPESTSDAAMTPGRSGSGGSLSAPGRPPVGGWSAPGRPLPGTVNGQASGHTGTSGDGHGPGSTDPGPVNGRVVVTAAGGQR